MDNTNESRQNLTPEQLYGPIKSFKKRGRPKKRPREFSRAQIYKDVIHISSQKVYIMVEGKRKLMTYGEAVIYRLYNNAVVKGDNNALKQLVELMTKAVDDNVDRKPTIFGAINSVQKEMDEFPNMQTYRPMVERIDDLRKATAPL